jgi:predicted CXXCH cytochrome family protein
MTFLIRTIDFTATGREIIRDRIAETARLTIGRATHNDIIIPDLAVEQEHAAAEQAADGEVTVYALGTLGFTEDGRKTAQAAIDPSAGAELGFGTYRLQFSRAETGQTLITIRQEESDEGARDAVRGFALASAMPGKRAMAWTALVAILTAFLAIPIWSHLSREDGSNAAYSGPAQEAAQKAPLGAGRDSRPDQVLFDSSWSTGALSLAHHGLEDNCEACHAEPFVSVRDETCLSCHAEIGDHADTDRQLTGRGPFSAGEALQWAIAQSFGKEGPGSCTTCHTEHEGEGRMEPAAQAFCAECHDTMDTRLTDTALGNAGDFGTHHPQFQALIYTELGQQKPARVTLSAELREEHGLLFPHDLHMSKTGGAARMANNLAQYGDGLECKDCHVLPNGRIDFAPVNMEDNCEACHSLVYDKVGSTFRSLRHGDVDQMRADLAAMDRAPRRPITTGRRRPGQFARGGTYYQNFGRPQSNYIAINQALSRDGVCGECHIPTTANGRPDVMPVNLRPFYFVTGRFDHKAHEQEDCTSCHAAGTSSSANDLLIPAMESCRDCHQGEDARQAEVPSSCAMCHSYHPPTGRNIAADMPADHPAGARSGDLSRNSRGHNLIGQSRAVRLAQ